LEKERANALEMAT